MQHYPFALAPSLERTTGAELRLCNLCKIERAQLAVDCSPEDPDDGVPGLFQRRQRHACQGLGEGAGLVLDRLQEILEQFVIIPECPRAETRPIRRHLV